MLWIDNRSNSWTQDEINNFCNNLESSWPVDLPGIDSCEGRKIMQGTMLHHEEGRTRIINSLWHGIPDDANPPQDMDAQRAQ